MMKNIKLPFSAYLAMLFGIVVFGTAMTISWVSDRGIVELLESKGSTNTEYAARQIGAELEALFAPIEVGVTLMAHHRTTLATSLPIRLEGVSFFRETLLANKSAAAFYIGYGDGAFFLVRRLRNDGERGFFRVDGQVHFIVQSIDRDGGIAEGRHVFLDAEGRIIGEIERPGYPAEYDPRQRIWHQQAMGSDGLIRTDLYIFQTTGQIGLTFAQRSTIGDSVVAADLTLDTLSAIVARLKPTRGAQIVLLNESEQIVAHESSSSPLGGMVGDTVQLIGLANFPVPALSGLAGKLSLAGRSGALIRYRVGDRPWLAKSAPIALRGGAPLTLLVAMPEDELLAEAMTIRDQILITTFFVFLGAIILILFFARSTSARLGLLNDAAERVRRFDFSQPFHGSSKIREIDLLSRNFEKLGVAYASFMRLLDLIQQETDKATLSPILLNEFAQILSSRKAVFYAVSSGSPGLMVEAVKDGDRIFLFRNGPPGGVPALISDVIDPASPGYLLGRIEQGEFALPGINSFADLNRNGSSTLAFRLADGHDHLVGAILFPDCVDPSDGAVELVNALTRTMAIWLRARQGSIVSSGTHS